MNTTTGRILLLIGALLIIAVSSWAVPPDTDTIPPELEHWKPWVLHGKEEHFCPTIYNNGEAHQCVWPSRLQLKLGPKGGRFSQQWQVFVKGWVPLPGSAQCWPHDIRVDGQPVPVIPRDEASVATRGEPPTATVSPSPSAPPRATARVATDVAPKDLSGQVPFIYLEPGKHQVEGAFTWDEMPELIDIPATSGLVALVLNDVPVDFPVLESSGKLWLQKRGTAGAQEDRLEVKIYRFLDDTIPMQVTTVAKINISGQAREIRLDDILLDKAIPMSLTSVLPARLEADGRLLVQGRPGRYEIRVRTRFEGPVYQLGPVRAAYGQEVWVFHAQNHLRMANLEGAPGVDPKQTEVPRGWEKYPAYLVDPKAVITFKEIRRGDPDPAPDQLHLRRNLWLDFAGTGFTIQDQIDGAMSRQWYLAMNPPGMLGRVTLDEVDQLITSQGPDQKPGVELRKGQLHLVAESRYQASTSTVPAVGWDHDFQSLSAELRLPPGWRLLTTRGVDVMPGTWFERWTLLDLFLVLIISLAVVKLWNWRWGLLALAALTLSYHEPGAPRSVWLALLALVALVRFLPDGRARKWFNACRWIALLSLLVISLPFVVQQIRWGIFPQLEPIHGGPNVMDALSLPMAPKAVPEMPAPESKMRALKAAPAPPGRAAGKAEGEALGRPEQQAALLQDPKALVQTGPGLPTWSWRTISLKWNGPVARDQQIRLWLLSPTVNLVLAFVRVLLLTALVLLVLDLKRFKSKQQGVTFELGVAVLIALCTASAYAAEPPSGSCSNYPPSELLQQLQNRLLERPKCFPICADSPRLELQVSGDAVRMLFQVHAAVEAAVPLPGNANSWLAEQVLLDNQPADGLQRDKEGSLWLLTPKGLHTVTLVGKPRPGSSFQIPLPLRPRQVQVNAKDYEVQGVHADGQVEGNLLLTRLQKEGAAKPEEWGPTPLPPFLQVERVLALGLTWQVSTTVKRLTPAGSPVVLSVPLIPGESVTTANIRVENGQAHLNLDAGRTEIRWSSTLERTPTLQLTASPVSDERPWTETWVLDASPVWHCDLEGIPVIHHQDQAGVWKPQWQPWPGEAVTIRVSRPESIPGQLVTIDDEHLELTPGERYQKLNLSVKIRTSQGAQHPITLPAGARLQQVLLDGKSLPISPSSGDKLQVTVPLQPGAQTVTVEWQQDQSAGFITRAPAVRIGDERQTAVNANVTFKMPLNRWILWTGGPRFGPAVIFWSYFVVVVLIGVALGRVPWTPLKTRHWLLLSLGLTQVSTPEALVIVGWFLALGWRDREHTPGNWLDSNWMRLLLIFWSLFAFNGLYRAIRTGLLGIPDMQIAGNGSSNLQLNWTEDRIGAAMPQPWVLSVPLYVYRGLMLLWALWLALALLKWLRWAWQCYGKGGLWHPVSFRRRKKGKGGDSIPSPAEVTGSETAPHGRDPSHTE